jgi:hypothetical protein
MKNLPNHKRLMYRLKRDWGSRVVLYRLTSETKDVRTGKTIRRYQALPLQRVAILPKDTKRLFVYDLDYIQAGRNFTKGAFFDKNARNVIIDAKDLPKHFIPSLNDFLAIRGKRYKITTVEELERIAGFGLKITTVENQSREKWIYATTCIDFAASVTA